MIILSLRQHTLAVSLELIQMFTRALLIKKRRFDDLQYMKHMMPSKCHHLFDTLSHQYAKHFFSIVKSCVLGILNLTMSFIP